MDEEDFPRGRSTKKTGTSSLDKKPIKRKRDQEVLFKDDSESSERRTSKLKQRRSEKKSNKPRLTEDEDDDDDESPLKMFKYDEEILKQIGGIADGLQSAVETVPQFTHITKTTISEGMLVLGAIKEIHDYEVVVSLPNMMTGYVQITELSSNYTKLLEKLGNDEVDILEEVQGVPNLQNLYSIGRLALCKVKSVGSSKSGRQRVILTLDPQAVYSHLSPSMLHSGMTMFGSISSKEDHGYIINIGVAGVNSFLSNNDAKSYIDTCNQGQPLIIAQPVQCLIKEVKSNGRSLVLSANPVTVSKATANKSSHSSFASLLPGTRVKATIQKIFSDNMKVSLLKSFSGCINQLHFETNITDTKEYKENQMVRACVIFNCPLSKSLGLSLKPAHVEPVSQDEPTPFEDLKTGDILKKSEVLSIDEKLGMLVQLTEESRGFVYLSHISDKKMTMLKSVYSVGSKVTVRILDFNLMDMLATVSMKKSVLVQSFLGYHDIQPGSLVKGTVTAIVEKGLRIKISDYVNGFVPQAHMADVIIRKPQSRFSVGEKLQLRVLIVDPSKRRLLLTHKKSLVESTLPVITSYDQPEMDMILHGFIVAIKDFGYLVRFYNDITGLIPRVELCSGQTPVPDSAYFVGQVVKCRVVRTLPPEQKRITLSLKLTRDSFTKETEFKNPNLGELTDVKVTTVRDLGLHVIIQPGGIPAFLPKMHLSDFVENCAPMLASYEKDDILTNVMHWSFSSTRSCAVVTQKPMLIQASQNKELIRGFSEIESGALVMGVVKRVMPYGVFIELPSNVVGLAPKAAMSDEFVTNSNAFHVGQTIRARVTEVDNDKSRFLLSLKSSSCHPKKEEDRLLMEQYFNERDCICKKLARMEAWKQLLKPKIGKEVKVTVRRREPGGLVCQLPNSVHGFIDNCYIGDDDVEEGSKVSAYVLNVNLNAKVIELCLDPKTINLDAEASRQKAPKKSKGDGDGEATVAMVKDDFIMVCLNSSGRIAYIPARRHLNDIRIGDDCLTVGQTIKVAKQRTINQRVLTAQSISQRVLTAQSNSHKKMSAPPASKTKDIVASEKPAKKSNKKTMKGVFQANNLQLGQKVTAVIKCVLDLQLTVRVNNVIMGRVHVTEVMDKMVSNKSPLKGFHVGQEVEAKVIGYLEVKDHNYLPVTHTNFTKMAVDLTLRPSKLKDDKYKAEDETVEKQLQSFVPKQRVCCVVQKFVQNMLWVAVSGTLQGKVYQLNLSKSIGAVEKPAKFFKPGMVRQAKVVKVDQAHKVLELTFAGTGSTEVTPGMVVNGLVSKIVAGVGLVIQLPFGHHGKVFLTDLRDHFTKDALKGYKKKQCIRCCVLEAPNKDNIVLSTRPSALSKHTDPAMDKDVQSIKDLKVGDIVKGYVSNCSKVGVFVSVSRKLQGRIQLKNLSSSYVKNPEPLFPKGMLLTVKVLSNQSGKIELSSSSAETGAQDPIPAHLRIKKKEMKRKRTASEGDNSDSGLEEPETLSDSEVEVVQKPREDEPVSRLNVVAGFSWDSSVEPEVKKRKKMLLGNEEGSDSDESEEEEEEEEEEKKKTIEEPSQMKSKKEKEAKERADEEFLFKTERELMDADRTPETSEEYDRLVLSSPDSSLVWIRYMAFYLQSAEIDKARAVAERALKTISFREEQEKLNVWVSFLNLENLYGTEESLLQVFERALQHCEPIKVFQNLVTIYVRTDKLEPAEQLYNSMVKRFNFNKEVWISYGYFLMSNGRHAAAHKLMQRSFKSLTQKEHVDVIVKFAQMEFKFSEAERGKTMFENVLSNYPKRTDIWSVYLDMMIKEADVQAIRHVFERVIHLSLSAKKMKFFFKRYLDFEKKCGTEASVTEVKRKALEYVESKMAVDTDS